MAMVSGRRRRVLPGLLLALGVAVLLAWSLLPIYWIAVTSLKPEREIYALPPTLIPAAPTLANYATVLFNTRFPLFLRNSLLVALVTTLAAVSIGTKPAFVLTWLLSCYVILGVIETILAIPKERRDRAAARAARTSIPPST